MVLSHIFSGDSQGPTDKQDRRNSVDGPLSPERAQHAVLIVDDDMDFLESLQELLELRDYFVCVADNIAGAEQATRSYTPDVALIDVKLGTENGLDLISELKRINPRVACVVMTAYPNTEYASRAFQSGAVEFLSKPLNLESLYRILRDLLGTGEIE